MRIPHKNPIFLVTLFLMISFSMAEYSSDQELYSSCAAKSCGNVSDIHYPFYLSPNSNSSSGDVSPVCGYPGFNLSCANNNTTLLLYVPPPANLYLVVKSIDYANRNLTVSLDYSSQINITSSSTVCTYPNQNLTIPQYSNPNYFPYSTTASDQTSTFYYNCITPPVYVRGGFSYDILNNLVCNIKNGSGSHAYSYVFYGVSGPTGFPMRCNETLTAPVLRSMAIEPKGVLSVYRETLDVGFGLGWNSTGKFDCLSCESSGGRCGYNVSATASVCFCQNYSHAWTCRDQDSSGINMKRSIIISAAAAGIFALLIIILGAYFCHSKRKKRLSLNSKVESFLDQYKGFTPKRYSYKQIKVMTRNFKEKLGEGGYGTVYKGKLKSQVLVAVKLLTRSQSEGQDFINEVATVGRIHHVNVVPLLGFCVEGSKRAVVYEFMPNGSLQSLISSEQVATEDDSRWENLYNIAKMIAEGIEYLHQGCNQQILHFDIKPSNILLDENFIPKISDFGLAKLCSREQSAVSTMTAAKGTMGYMAPEVFYGRHGTVSHKSDVYSFGMLLMEMVGLRNHSGNNDSSLSDLYFPEWVHDCLVNDRELGVDVDSPTGRAIVKKLSIIGLFCIQWHPNDRPSMKNVIQMFDASVEELQLPGSKFLPSDARENVVDIETNSSGNSLQVSSG